VTEPPAPEAALAATDPEPPPSDIAPETTAAAPVEPAPSPFEGLPTGPSSVVVGTFDLLTRASVDIRRGSFYIGLIVLGTVAPVVLLAWGLQVAIAGLSDRDTVAVAQGPIGAWLGGASLLAVVGALVAIVESRSVAVALLGARLEGRPLQVRDAVQRSRMVFWHVVAATLLISGPLTVVQYGLAAWLATVFHGVSEVTTFSAAIIAAILGTPFAYVTAGIVLGDVGAIEATRRSIRLFGVRRRSALVVSLFAFAAQLLTGIGLGSGLDLVLRVFDALGLGPDSGDVGVAITSALIVIIVFAFGTLLFTVTAIAAAPQVLMFLALTHARPGLAKVRAAVTQPQGPVQVGWGAGPPPVRWRFRWLTRPMLLAIVIGAMTAAGGLASLNR
jgi:hypothetical protein